MLTRDHTVLPATHTFIHKWNEPYEIYFYRSWRVSPVCVCVQIPVKFREVTTLQSEICTRGISACKRKQYRENSSYLGVNHRDLSGVSISEGVPTGPSMLWRTNKPSHTHTHICTLDFLFQQLVKAPTATQWQAIWTRAYAYWCTMSTRHWKGQLLFLSPSQQNQSSEGYPRALTIPQNH